MLGEKEPSPEKGEQKGRQQKSVGALVAWRAARLGCGVGRDPAPVR